MLKLIFTLVAVSLPTSIAYGAGSICSAKRKLERLPESRCANFSQFSDSEVLTAKTACSAFYESIRESTDVLCEYSMEAERFDSEARALLSTAKSDRAQLASARHQLLVRSSAFHRRWGTQLAGGPRRQLESANHAYKKALEKLNDFGLSLLREEATSCGRPQSAPSPAYVGLALTAAYEAAYTHQYMSRIFNAMVESMGKQAAIDADYAQKLGSTPAGSGPPTVPGADRDPHVLEPGVKTVISEAIGQVLRLEGLSSLGVDLADKLLISQSFDLLDLIVISSKAIVITAGGASAGPTVGISVGISLAINGAIDYLEYNIRKLGNSFEKLARARMDEVLKFYDCKLSKNRRLNSSDLARSYHLLRQDGICDAPCAERGMFGLCRPSLVFTANRCE